MQPGQTNVHEPQTEPSRQDSPSERTKFKSTWEDSLKHKKNTKIADAVEILLENVVTHLEVVFSDPATRNQVVDDITTFLKDEENAYGIDSYVRSLMLFYMVNREKLTTDVELEVIRIIVEAEKLLSFESPSQNSTSDPNLKLLIPVSIWFRCQGPKGWKSGSYSNSNSYLNSTPFHRAAYHNQVDAVKYMIQGVEQHFKVASNFQPISALEVLQVRDPARTKGPTALETSVKEGRLNMIRELLKYPKIAEYPDKSFVKALTNGYSEIIEIFLKLDHVCDTYVNKEYIMKALTLLKEKKQDGTWKSRKNIVHAMLKRATRSKGLDDEVISTIIQMNLIEAWKECKTKAPTDHGRLLHLAVSSQNTKFVELFVKENPRSVTIKALIQTRDTSEDGEEGQGYYPLWYNNRKWVNNKWVEYVGSSDIRELLVTTTIRQINNMRSLSDILEQSAGRDLFFDISRLKPKSYRLSDFIHSLTNHRENKDLLSYEKTIKYASFPVLDLYVDNEEPFGRGPYKEHREVFDILDWLQNVKGVKSVLELKVPDRLLNPHNELMIAEYVHNLGVEVLDWRFLDMSLSVFSPEVKRRIRTLCLYASGKWAAIAHWLSKDGLESFPNLSEVRIFVIQEMMTKTYFARVYEDLSREVRAKFSSKPKIKVIPQSWKPRGKPATNLEEIAQEAFPKLSRFISSYREYVDRHWKASECVVQRTKVAIIDNGILSMHPASFDSLAYPNSKRPATRKVLHNHGAPNGKAAIRIAKDDTFDTYDNDLANPKTLWSWIKGGKSFVDDDSQGSSWLFASDPHGTQMANLICALDPGCELYIAKVADDRFGITPERVSKAIDWARQNKVDIISMSFTMLETTPALKQSIKDANQEDIVMFCSSHDEGSNVLESWPADAPETKTVVACDEYGTLFREIEPKKYDYRIPCVNVPAGTVPFLESNTHITGSSVATATAAGLGSLMLSCARLSNQAERSQRITIINSYFKAMLSSDKSQYVLLEKFGDIDAKVKEGEPIIAQDILSQKFFVLHNTFR
ncbi:Peptidase S8/S53, subtilisin/kexin/sedolisin, partial [Metarhizium majus ARSEF 297]